MSKPVPEGWSVKPLSALANYYNGRAFKPEDWSTAGLPIIRIAQINNRNAELDYYVGDDVSEKNLIRNGDLLFSWSATLTALLWNRGDAVLNQHIFKVEEKEGVDKSFLHQLILGSIESLAELSHGSTIKHIKKGVLDEYLVETPPLCEQKKIAAVLASVDKVIEKNRKKLDALNALKTGMMQELFTNGIGANGAPHEEFKKSALGLIPVEWSICTLGDVTEESAFGPRFSSDCYSERGNIGCIRTTDIDNNWNINYSSAPLADLNLQEYTDHILREGDLLVTRSGTCGVVDVFQEQSIPMVAAAFLIRFRLSSAVNPWFIRNAMMSTNIQESIQLLASGGVQKNLSGTNLKTLLLPLPSKSEQDEIVKAIDSVNRTIQRYEKKVQHLSLLKKALMQDLLTGKVRVKIDEREKELEVA